MSAGKLPVMERPPFHLAFPVDDLEAARGFYAGLLGCAVGREAERWIDFDFFGHQITAHVVPASSGSGNEVDGDRVPVPHFGAILDWERWHELAERLQGADVVFEIGPRVRFQGEVGEQATMFFRDPSGNPIELKSFRDPARIFARET